MIDVAQKMRRLIASKTVRDRYGVSDMSLYRWLRDPKLNFPQPIIINGRRFWYEDDLETWERSRAKGGAA